MERAERAFKHCTGKARTECAGGDPECERRVHGAGTRVCSKCACSVQREDAQSMQENMWSPWRERTWRVQLRLPRACTEYVWSVLSVH